jgi:hypothetical protein
MGAMRCLALDRGQHLPDQGFDAATRRLAAILANSGIVRTTGLFEGAKGHIGFLKRPLASIASPGEFQVAATPSSTKAAPKNRRMREQLIAHLTSAEPNSDVPPVVPLEDYFEGNTEEYSIAPNQVGEGRPSIERMYEILKAIKARPDVQTVVVGLHPDWKNAMDDPDMWPAGEHIHIYTTARSRDVENWVMELRCDGVLGAGLFFRNPWPHGKHAWAPEPLPGYRVLTVVWD